MMNSKASVQVLILSMMFVLVMVSISCNLPMMTASTEKATSTMVVSVQESPLPFMEITVTSHPVGRIVILSVETDNSEDITGISLQLPDSLRDSQIMINGEAAENVERQEGEVNIDLAGGLSSQQIALVFNIDGKQIAICNLDANELLEPEGDCGW